MTERKQNEQAAEQAVPQADSEKKQDGKQRVLKHGATALVRSIASAIVVKNEGLFLLTEPDGRIPLSEHHGFGLYYHDCRFLNGYEIRIGPSRLSVLASTATRGYMAAFDLTNPDISMEDGTLIRKEQIGIRWERTLDSGQHALYDRIMLQNFSMHRVRFPISLTFEAAFEDVMQVRGAEPDERGVVHAPRWKGNVLHFEYDGADHLYRSLAVSFSATPQQKDTTSAEFQISLKPRQQKELLVALCITEAPGEDAVKPRRYPTPDLKQVMQSLQDSSDEWMASQTEITCDSALVGDVLSRSLRDLAVLRSNVEGQEFFAAGVPWFVALFGRDSLITALQTLFLNPAIAEQTLRLLARYQGQRVDEWRDEEPGKILHELRVGEMAHLNEIPQTPYYGSVDSTPLFLVLVARHAAWTGDLALFKDLKGNVERALEWVDRYGDQNADGYVEYESKSKSGLTNQGWKDSGDSVMNADGTLAKPPIALVEVQGYVYLAKTELAELFDRTGDNETGARLRREALELRKRFNRDFWMKDKGFLAMALQAGGKPADVVSSNPGQALWSGIMDQEKAKATVERLMADDMFNGWGIRTLSQQEWRYNPIGYHLGTVWPHDNSIIAAGFRKYGFEHEICRVFTGLVEAAMGFRFFRLPELFAGFRREDYGVPVRYPVACHPQAWAAGSIPYIVESMLGLAPEAFERRLRIVRPILPDMIRHLEVHRLQVGQARVDIHFDRTPDGGVAVTVPQIDGDLQVLVEPTTPLHHAGSKTPDGGAGSTSTGKHHTERKDDRNG